MLTKEGFDQVRKNHDDAKARAVSSNQKNNTVVNKAAATITKEVIPMKHKDDGQDDVTIERSARNDFDSSVAIRAEFENVNRYIAFRKAEARGKMKILGGVVRSGA